MLVSGRVSGGKCANSSSHWCPTQREANCIGLVKLMGRHCGFIAMNAALAARDVDICHLAQRGLSPKVGPKTSNGN